MFRRVTDFLTIWAQEKDATHRVFAALTDASLSRSVDASGRTLGRLAWHIAGTIPEMMERTGLHFDAPPHDAPPPASAEEIGKTYAHNASSFATALESSWNDETLDVEDDMYGERWQRGFTLFALVGHQIHHRGQMTVLMRQAGLKVPGTFGPAREEWAAMGITAPL
jgi:uncharacterized damage-inducible protein DinB